MNIIGPTNIVKVTQAKIETGEEILEETVIPAMTETGDIVMVLQAVIEVTRSTAGIPAMKDCTAIPANIQRIVLLSTEKRKT